jgi:transposase-like protein
MTFIEAHCPSCGRYFRESANHLCEGQVLSCPHCEQSWALTERSPVDEVQRLLRHGREARQSRIDLASLPRYRWTG